MCFSRNLLFIHPFRAHEATQIVGLINALKNTDWPINAASSIAALLRNQWMRADKFKKKKKKPSQASENTNTET